MAGIGGNVTDGEVNKSTATPVATTEVTNPSDSGTTSPSLAPANAGRDNLIPELTEQSPLSPIACPENPSEIVVAPTLPSNVTTPLKSSASDQDGAAATTTPPCTLRGPSDPIISESTVTGGSAAETPSRTIPGTSVPTRPEPNDGNEFKTGEADVVPSLVPVEETAIISAPPSGSAAGLSTLNATTLIITQPNPVVNKPIDDSTGVTRRRRSKRGRPREPLTFGANKQAAIHNVSHAPLSPPPASTPPRVGTTNTDQAERTPPPPPSKRIKNGKGIASSSSPAGLDSPPPPSPIDAANSDSQVLRNRKGKDGNVRWYFSSAGATSSRKGSNILLPPPPPPPSQQPPVQGPQLPYPCTICGIGFYTIRSLCGHMKAHPGRQWRGAFPPPDNLFPALAFPVLGAEDEGDEAFPALGAEDEGREAGEDYDNIEGEMIDQGDMRPPSPEPPSPEGDMNAQAEAGVPPAGEVEEVSGAGKNPLDWDLNGPPPTESDEDRLGGDQ